MLLSMTGHGAARVHREGVSVAIEVRTVNSRYYKLSVRSTDGFAALEPRRMRLCGGTFAEAPCRWTCGSNAIARPTASG